MNKLDGKVAIVTGASKGIGAGIATYFAAAGASVIVNYASAQGDAERIVAAITSTGGAAIAVQADVSNATDVQRLFETATRHFGPLDVLVNNAGVYKFGPIDSVTEGDFHHHFNSNVLSVFLTIQQAMKHFGPQGGSIVNIATAGIELNSPGSSLYTATKSAVVTITRILAKELASRKIRVNAIAPGATETEGFHDLGLAGSAMVNQLIAATPWGRLARPEDIAPIAVFLASADAAWMTGDTLFASGGLR
jgi:3-oxoacyl-[acyl-carrier protein] reductase